MKLRINDRQNCGQYDVYLDGKGPIRYVVEADEEEGYIIGYEQREDGLGIVMENHIPKTYRKVGKVELRKGLI